jgi:hypothetical protein
MLGINANNNKKRGRRSELHRVRCKPIRDLGEDISGEVPYLEDVAIQNRLDFDTAYYNSKRMKKNTPGV